MPRRGGSEILATEQPRADLDDRVSFGSQLSDVSSTEFSGITDPFAEPPGGTELLMTLPEVAALLRLSTRSVRRLVAYRRFPCLRIGRSLRFTRSDVLRWLAARKEG